MSTPSNLRPDGSPMRRHLVTGAGSGIGEALAHRLLDRGDEVLVVGRDPGRAEQLGQALPGAQPLVADLADPAAVEAVADALPAELDSVVHSAGVFQLGPVAELPTEAWQRQVTVNLVAPAVLTRLTLPALRAKRGTVVLVNSGQGWRAAPTWSAYAASKFGLRGFADALRDEEAEHGVRVTSVYPGRVATPMQREVHAAEGKNYDPAQWIDPGTVADAIVGCLDLPADATVSDLRIQPRG